MAELWSFLRKAKIRSEDIELLVHETDLLMSGPGIPVRLPWSDVAEPIGFKRDCLSVDQINLEFRSHDGSLYCVNDDMQGWKNLVEILPTVPPGSRKYEEDWFTEVSHPPFAISRTVVFAGLN